MKKIQILLAALVAVLMSSCAQFKTEATVDVTVMKDGKTQAGVLVYKAVAHGDIGGSYYKQNYKDAPVKTNLSGVAHFELKSPDDLLRAVWALTKRSQFTLLFLMPTMIA